MGTALAILTEEADVDGWLRLEVTFQDRWHAEWALWQLGMHAEALAPPALRAALHAREPARPQQLNRIRKDVGRNSRRVRVPFVRRPAEATRTAR